MKKTVAELESELKEAKADLRMANRRIDEPERERFDRYLAEPDMFKREIPTFF